MNKEDYTQKFCDFIEEQKLEKLEMNITTQEKRHEILDKMVTIANYYDIIKITETSDKPDIRTLTYAVLGQGSLIADRVDSFMHEKYPNQDYEIRIKPCDKELEISLL
jgi:hypothetical protein